MKNIRVCIQVSIATCILAAGLAGSCCAQQLEPRRWSHLPVGINFAGGGYVYTTADIAFDPVLSLEDVKMDMHTIPLKYIRTFELFGKSARIDVVQAYQEAKWTGLLDGTPASTSRSGWSDLSLRLAVNLLGAPPLRGKEFKAYRAKTTDETIVGLGVVVDFPTGHYLEDRLLNLGNNRFTFRPQLGVVKSRDQWAAEVTVASWLFTDNDEFFDGNLLEQKPFNTIQAHFDWTFRPGLWAGAGVGFGSGRESIINGIEKNDHRENVGWVLSLGYPINPKWGFKFAYIGGRALEPFGADADSLAVAVSALW